MKERFYVYIHKRLSDESTFYVGKGSGKQAYNAQNRNETWKAIVDEEGGYDVHIVKNGLTNKDACLLEMRLIKDIGIDNLSNLTIGGFSRIQGQPSNLKVFKNVAISDNAHEMLKEYCDERGFKIGPWVEKLIKRTIAADQSNVLGSITATEFDEIRSSIKELRIN